VNGMQCWHLYLIRLANGHLYTGISTDVERRLGEHREGGIKGSKSLRGKGPLELVFSMAVGSRSDALKLEYAVKRLSKREKERLVSGGLAPEQLVKTSLQVSRG